MCTVRFSRESPIPALVAPTIQRIALPKAVNFGEYESIYANSIRKCDNPYQSREQEIVRGIESLPSNVFRSQPKKHDEERTQGEDCAAHYQSHRSSGICHCARSFTCIGDVMG